MTNGKYVNENFPIKDKRISRIFHGMMSRCYDKNCKSYRFYGAKGIKICDDWFYNRSNFEKWSLQNGYKDNLTIDRIDENGDYSPDNCQWIELKENCVKKSTTSFINVDGVIHSGKEWSRIIKKGINFVNRKIREKGLEETIEIIRNELSKLDNQE